VPGRNVPSVTVSPDGRLIFFYVAYWPRPGDPYVMYTKWSNGKWTVPERASFSKTGKNGEPLFSLDGSRIYLFTTNAGNQVSGVDLAYVERRDSAWSDPVSLGNPPNFTTDQYHPCVVADGSIYFASSSGDICRSQFVNGAFQKPEVLPYPINSANATQSWGDPYVSPAEDYLILKSTRAGGYGQNDIYISYRKPDGTWTNPKNLGDKINTSENERSGDVTPDGKYMTFSRGGTMYWVTTGFIERLRHTNFVPYTKSKIATQPGRVGQMFSYTIPGDLFIDDDGNSSLTYSASLDNSNSLPAWLQFDPKTGTFTGKPAEKGTAGVKVIATDTAGAAASVTFTIEVM
jgi:hypothetical protein